MRRRARPMSRIFSTAPGPSSSALVGRLLAGRQRHHQVGRFDVAVNQALSCRVLQAERRLPDEIAGPGHGQRAGLIHQALEVHAGDALHHQVMRVEHLTGLEDTHDVRMIQAGGRLHFAAKAAQGVAALEPFFQQHLESDQGAGLRQTRLVDDAHAALAEPVHQDIRTQKQPVGLAAQQSPDLEGVSQPRRTSSSVNGCTSTKCSCNSASSGSASAGTSTGRASATLAGEEAAAGTSSASSSRGGAGEGSTRCLIGGAQRGEQVGAELRKTLAKLVEDQVRLEALSAAPVRGPRGEGLPRRRRPVRENAGNTLRSGRPRRP